MSTIGGPPGVGGPKGPGAPARPSEIDEVAGDAPVDRSSASAGASAPAPATGTAALDALAAELAAGRVTPREAIDRLVEATVGPGLAEVERAELRALLGDLVANDPRFRGLMGSLAGNPIGGSRGG